MLTTAEAAAALGVTRRQVLKLIKENKLQATRFGIAWQVSEESVKYYQRTERKPGWKQGRKRTNDSQIEPQGEKQSTGSDTTREGKQH